MTNTFEIMTLVRILARYDLCWEDKRIICAALSRIDTHWWKIKEDMELEPDDSEAIL